MPIVPANDIEICYETTGDAAGQPLVLIHGYGSQLIQWPQLLCDELAKRGFFVIRMDNRDVGLSTKLDGQMPPFGPPAEGSGTLTLTGPPPYTLTDMAADAVGLLDALGIERAHFVGASLGGTIVQRIAISFPDRIRTLTSIMSATGSPDAPGATPEAAAALFAPTPTDRDAYIDHLVGVCKVIYGSYYDAEKVRAAAGLRYDRSFYPEGMPRQLAALISDGDRTAQLAGVACPTLVIHGRRDPLVPLANGEATAAAIPGAELVVFDEMGHDLPEQLCPEFADHIAKLAARA